MKAFEYATAHSTDSARQLAADNGAYLAGGNDLLGLLKDYLVSANILVNIKSLPGLDKIERGKNSGRLARSSPSRKSKMTRNQKGFSRPARSRVRSRFAANSQCRHRRRQPRAAFALLVFPPSRHGLPQKGGDLCYAREGDNRYHSLFTGNTCISPVVSSLATDFRGSRCHGHRAARRQGNAHEHGRALPSRVGKSARAQFAQQRRLDFARGNSDVAARSAYMQASDKHMFDWALVSCAAAAEVVDGKFKSPRVALGSISPVPHQVEAANNFLDGKSFGRRNRNASGGFDFEGRKTAGTQRLQGADGARAHPPHIAQTERRRMNNIFCKHLRTKKMFTGATPEEAFARQARRTRHALPFLVQPHANGGRRG
jgi:xanthine dehydrogenase YagS FAD-binding subunit